MRRLLAVAVLVALALSGTALAARGDPQKKINPADQARAKAMLVRKSDVPAGYRSSPPSTEANPYCAALDESDLTLTGEAESPDFAPRKPDRERGVLFVSSVGEVYESVADANESWRQGTSAAGEKCVRDIVRREIQKGSGIRFVSFRRVPFPRLAQRTVAYRVVAVSEGVLFHLDFVALQQSRGRVSIVVGVVPIQGPGAEVTRLARLIAPRLKTAMRGA